MRPVIDYSSNFDDAMHTTLRAAAIEGPTIVDAVSGSVVVLRYADVERLAFDARLAGVGLAFFDFMGIDDGSLRDWYGGLMFTNEGEKHRRLRSLVSRAFTPRAVDGLRAYTADAARACFDAMARDGGGDLVVAFGRLPMRVMCKLLGVPERDIDSFADWADALSPVFAFMTPEQIATATDAVANLLGYVEELATARRADPSGDLISGLLAAEEAGDRLSHDELVSMVANLIVGGHDTTASQLGCTFVTLLRHPDQAARVRDDHELLSSAVNESIRFEPAIAGVPRTATEAMRVADVDIDAGGLVLLSTAAANREAGVWKDPDTFDVARFDDPDVARLLSFGAGAHYCLGAALARLTVEESMRAFVEAVPAVQPEGDPFAVEWRSVLGRAPVALPVACS